MNKKLFLGMFATAALFVTSCSQEELVTPATGNEVMAEFTIEAPVEALQSRAIGDGTTVDKVVCAVFEDEANSPKDEIKGLRQTLDIVGKKATFKTRLVKGQSYRIAFFAYNEAAGAYDVTDLKNIKVDMTREANDEGRDAFTAYTEVTAEQTTSAINRTITLYRPFAQLNFGSYEEDIKAAAAAGIVVKTTQVTVDNVYTAFSAYDDAVVPGETTTMQFTWANQPVEALYVNDAEYDYLAMNYLLVGNKDEKALTNVVFQWTAENGKTNEPVAEFGNVPVQRNYRTNILGYLLTNPAEFNIVIDEKFETPDYLVEVVEPGTVEGEGATFATLDEAVAAAAAGDVLTLGAGEYTLTKNINKNITITSASTDAKITLANVVNASGSDDIVFNNITFVSKNTNYFGIQHCNNLTFNNCVIENQIYCYSDLSYKTTFNNCTFEQSSSDWYNVWTYASNVDFNDCVFNSAGKAALVYAENSTDWRTINFKNCEFNASTPVEGKAAIEIDSSLCPYNVNIEGCTANGFANGSKSGNSLFNLKKGEEGVNCNLNVTIADGVVYAAGSYALSTANGMKWFANEVNVNNKNFAGETVKLASDIDLAGATWAPVGQTGATEFKGVFDGQNYTISNLTIDSSAQTGATYSSGLFGWVESHGAEGVTIKNVKVDGATVKGHHNVAVIVGYVYGTVDNCHVTNATLECTHANDDACGDKCGTIAGYVGEDATISNCTADQVTISAGRDAGAIAGAAKAACVVNCSATNVTAAAVAGCNHSNAGGNISNDVIGRVL